MNQSAYLKMVSEYKPKEDKVKNAIIAFLVGGLMGALGELLTMFYEMFDYEFAETYMIITLISLGCLFTALNFFDELVKFARAGLIIPITGFAHSVMSAVLEYRSEGLINGIGSNTFKLAGTVIVSGVVSSFIVSIIRIILGLV